MFTGLVQDLGEITAVDASGDRVRLAIATTLELAEGDSVAVNGVCLTATAVSDGHFAADVMNETLRRSSLAEVSAGSKVNLELPLRAADRLGGHFVQGHVDEVGRVEAVRADADFHWITVSFPPLLAPFLVHRGSIAVDGISLTIAGLAADRFDVQVVPFTMTHTNLGRAAAGAAVNIEVDILGKYVARAVEVAGLGMKAAYRGEVAHQHQV